MAVDDENSIPKGMLPRRDMWEIDRLTMQTLTVVGMVADELRRLNNRLVASRRAFAQAEEAIERYDHEVEQGDRTQQMTEAYNAAASCNDGFTQALSPLERSTAATPEQMLRDASETLAIAAENLAKLRNLEKKEQ